MNDLSASEPTRSQITWSSLPWGIFFVLLAVFVFATPLYMFDMFKYNVGFVDARGAAEVMHRDNWMRIIALLALGAFALFNLLRFKPGRFQINGLLGWLILFYLVWAVLSITWSIEPRFTLKRVGIFLMLSLGALYVAYRLSFQEIRALVFFICAVAVLLGFVVALWTNNFFPFRGWWRFGNNMHPINQAWHLGLLLLSALALDKTAKQNRAVYIGIVIIASLFLILTRSRMPFLSCIMASAVYLGLVSTKRYQGVLLFLGIIIVGCLIYFILGSEFLGFSEKVVTLGRVGEINTAKTLTGRIPLWSAVMQLVDQRPFLGYGYDSFLTGRNLIWVSEEAGWATSSPHSGYIATLGGLGYIGFITLVLILILSVTMSINLSRQNPDYAFIAAVFVWLIFNLYTEDQVLTRPYFPVFAWMVLLAKLGFIREES